MRRYVRSIMLLCLVLPPLLVAGCAGKSSRFYTLAPVKSKDSSPSVHDTSSPAPPYIGIVSVEIPDYLDRPQIVTRNPDNELKVAEFDRWGGELQNDIARVLAETLSAQFPGDRVFILTGRRVLPADYRITVQVTRFDPVPGDTVWLKAVWTVLGKDGRQVVMRGESDLVEPIGGRDYASTVAAMSRAVDQLGRQIAGAVKPRLALGATGTFRAELP